MLWFVGGESGSVRLKPEDYSRAMKLCKFATSALQYEDTKTAVDNLTKALKLLTTGQEEQMQLRDQFLLLNSAVETDEYSALPTVESRNSGQLCGHTVLQWWTQLIEKLASIAVNLDLGAGAEAAKVQPKNV